MNQIEVPSFATEAEEAAWWFDNQDLLDEEFIEAGERGLLHESTTVHLAGFGADYVASTPSTSSSPASRPRRRA